MKFIFTPICVFFFISSFLSAQNLPKLSGLMFGDYFYNLKQNNSNYEGMNGFQFRRIFITTDYKIADNFNSRFRLEADNIYDMKTSSNKMNVWVKDAYLEWVNIFEGSNLFIGISPTPAFEISTRVWNNRFLEKTIMDYYGIVSSRDMGIDLKGNLIADGNIKYWIKIGNNANSGPENNRYKRFYGLLEFHPYKNMIITTYADYSNNAFVFDKTDNTSKKHNSIVVSFFGSYRFEKISFGIETFYRTIQNGYKKSEITQLENLDSYGISMWAYYSLNDKINIVGRYDYYDPNTVENFDHNSLILFAFDYKPVSKVHLSPNCEIKTYYKGSNDVVPRLTFFWEF